MNYFKAPESQWKSLADSVGDFIQYWGFRKIHGQIWTLVYLAKKPISATEITRLLNVSKALVSLGISELQEFQLIEQVSPEGRKVKNFKANRDVMKVIRQVLRSRESVLLNKVEMNFAQLEQVLPKNSPDIESTNLSTMKEMIENAQAALAFLLELESLTEFRNSAPPSSPLEHST